VPHLRALAERDGLLYAAADNFADGFALAVSSDEATFRPLLRYDGVGRVRRCVATACVNACSDNVRLGLWSQAVCTTDSSASAAAPKTGCSMHFAPARLRTRAPWWTLGLAAFVHVARKARRREWAEMRMKSIAVRIGCRAGR
jgi:hypothetical protein